MAYRCGLQMCFTDVVYRYGLQVWFTGVAYRLVLDGCAKAIHREKVSTNGVWKAGYLNERKINLCCSLML
ncbi:hypothetical protein I79_021707 [Cricetulus griseus]|uniref:Uncharacterized protein n=1 Tax=Cricetulus griseus TaxID=10029 RepID=G3IDD1_CRIGR|nr:hypothetical protein I79_021707 [Cricetulus griseus]